MSIHPTLDGTTLRGPVRDDEVLSPAALALLAGLTRRFRPALEALLTAREARQAAIDAGALPDFLPETRWIREGDWSCAPTPPALLDRRVEITGPTDRKMVINALNSGANVFMADFEDSTAPTLANVLSGQRNLMDAVRGTITYTAPETGKVYALGANPAALMVRPRGLHLPERHLLVDGAPVPGPIFDAALFALHNATEQRARGAVPAFYLPKLQHHSEAAWWDELLGAVEAELGLPPASLKVTVLIETLPAAFQMHEILYALRERIIGLNCGRWDYIFSFIKTLRAHPAFVLPDRGQVTMLQPAMRAYTQLLIQTCHRRGVHAMGGMAAQIPIKEDPEANALALARVRADKLREVADGHDGTWVAHPGLVPLAREIFDGGMPGPNQRERLREDVVVRAAQLLAVPHGTRTEAGARHNLRVGVQYLEAWLRGLGCVPLYHLMEDAATAEICRAQLWQWLRHGATLDDGAVFDRARFDALLAEACAALVEALGPARWGAGRFAEAVTLFTRLCTAETLDPFLTLPAYDLLSRDEPDTR